MRLLLVEDESDLADLVGNSLARRAYAVDTVGSLEAADLALSVAVYDAVVLDLRLPDGDGIDLLRRMRARGNGTPVIIASAREAVEERIRGLNAGADDYLPKPFSIEELIARVRAVLRRPGHSSAVTLRLGNLLYDTVTGGAAVDGRALAVTRRERGILELLLRRAGRPVSREALEQSVYSFDDGIGSNALEAHISRLRKRLAEAGASPRIATIRGVGYLLVEPEA